MSNRPKLKIELTTSDKILEIFGWLAVITVWTFTWMNYKYLPSDIPIHFNIAGEIDHIGSKSNILLLPIVSTLLYLGLTILNQFPHYFNYPTTITDENAYSQYKSATRMIRYLKLVIVLIFGSILFRTIQIADNNGNELGIWFLPLILGSIFVPLIVYILKSNK